jgi:hypothetical protein
MSRLDFSILKVSSRLNDVLFHDVECLSVEGKGWGLVSTRDLTDDLPTLLRIPHDLVLNKDAVEEYSNIFRQFKELYDAVGRQVFAIPPTTLALGL